MIQTELFLISLLRTLVEVAGFALLGQGLLAILAGAKRNDNFVYRLFQVVTSPVTRLVRLVTPRFVIDRHIPFLSFFLLFWLWLALAFAKRYFCTLHNLNCFG